MSMQVPFLDLPAQHRALAPELEAAFKETLSSCAFCSGPAVEAFEKEFASFIGSREAIGVNSGTSALHLALLAAGIGPGDEVVTPAMTFLATAAAIEYAGAKPVLADVEADTYCLDATKVESVLTDKTKAVIPVHLYGQPADVPSLLPLAKQRNLTIIEDAAQAHGASLNGLPCGAMGDLAAFSFYPGKNLGACGEAGAVTTGDAEKARLIRSMRDWGQEGKGVHANPGFNHRMDGLQGAFLSIKLKRLHEWTDARIRIAGTYRELLADLQEIQLPVLRPGARHAHHIFAVLTPDRDRIAARMKEAGVSCGVHYPVPIHLHPSTRRLGYACGDFPNAERLAEQELSLPLYPELTEEQAAYVADALRNALRSSS